MTSDVVTAEPPPRSYCVGGCGRSFLHLVADDGMAVDPEFTRWAIGVGADGYTLAWCPVCREPA
jgi:hypothetical protein